MSKEQVKLYSYDNIDVYIFNWKKTSTNSLILYEKISKIIKNITIVNCDESLILDDSIKKIQLDDSHYYGSQYEHAINDVRKDSILCVIVGDNISNNNFDTIFGNAIDAFNNISNLGVFSPNDKRSTHKKKYKKYKDNLYNVPNTDCGFWFIHPSIITKLRNIKYGTISKYGWGIDIITIKQAKKDGLLVLRDYSIETDQLDHSCGYNHTDAKRGMKLLEDVHEKLNI